MNLILAKKLSDSDVSRLAEKLNTYEGKFGILVYETSAIKRQKVKDYTEPVEFTRYYPDLGVACFKEDSWAGWSTSVKLKDLKYLKFGEEVFVDNFELTF